MDVIGFTPLDYILEFTMQIAAPFYILSYYLYFYKDRYKKLLTKYEFKKPSRSVLYYVAFTFIFLITTVVLDRVL